MNLYDIFKIDFIAVLLIIFFFISTFFIFSFFLKKERLLTKTTLFTTGISFFLPYLFFLLNQIFHIKSIPPDTKVYADLILDFGKNFNSYSFGVTGYSILNYIPFKFCFGRPAVFIVFNIFYYQIAILYLFKAFKMYSFYNDIKVGKRLFVIFQLLSLLYPIALIHTSSILREPMMLMMFSINLYFLVRFYYSDYKKYWMLSIFLLFLFFIRPLTGVCMLLIFFIGYVHKKKLLTLKNFLKFSFFTAILFFVGKRIILSLYLIDFSMEWIAHFRKLSNFKFGVEGYHSLDWSSSLYYIKNFILIISQYILSPLPILVDINVTFNKLIPLTDSIFIIMVIFLPILIFKKKFYNKWLFAFMIFIVLPAIVETNISGAYRHRMNGIFMLLPLSAYIFSLFTIKKQLNVKK